VHAAFDAIAALSGPGSTTARRDALVALFGRATADERQFLSRLVVGELRQGALEGVMFDAIAQAAGLAGGLTCVARRCSRAPRARSPSRR